jgi:hypothetical protein
LISGVVLFTIASVLLACERRDIVFDDIPVLSISSDIVYPPDSFKLIFPLRYAYQENARIIFDTVSTWQIEKLNAYSSTFSLIAKNDSSLTPVIIYDRKTLQFEGNVIYEFLAETNHIPSTLYLMVVFRKRD